MSNTPEQSRIVSELEKLIGHRFNLETLQKKITKIFGCQITPITDITREDDECSDYNLMFSCDEQDERYGYFDLYFLPTRMVGDDAADKYITEIGYEFDN